jgi:enoyl-CoA hydratase/carnithine racemase
MADDELELDLSGAVATVVFNRPHKANAIRPDWPRRILEFLREVECLPRVRCVLFSAKGKHFQAGGELDAQNMTDVESTRAARLARGQHFQLERDAARHRPPAQAGGIEHSRADRGRFDRAARCI